MRKQDEAILFEVLRHPLYGSLGHLRVRESGMEFGLTLWENWDSETMGQRLGW
jgi:hypothetical protein